ncbi:MAG: PIN domain-containing protein [Methyloglobulus sp.]|nr:PIN domain-containing protein [Methyloglobulus sp.]
MKIYLDNCCLNRPFDDQSNPRIHLEAEAVKAIITMCEQGNWLLISSHVLIYEINNAPDRQRANIINMINQLSKEVIPITENIRQRAKTFEKGGLQAFDALHLASAEENADVFLTTDDQFLKKARQISGLTIKVSNPLHWLEEILP